MSESDLPDRIADLIRSEQSFREADVAEACGEQTKDPAFRLALHKAIDILREEGIEFAPVQGEPGMRHRVQGLSALRRARRFHRGALRKLGRAGTQLSNINPNDLSGAEREALRRTHDHTKRLVAATHLSAQQGQDTSNLLAKMSEPKAKKSA